MKMTVDSFTGPLSYLGHVLCGLIFGGGLGAWLGLDFFETGRAGAVGAVVSGGVLALAAGRWGPDFWMGLLEVLLLGLG